MFRVYPDVQVTKYLVLSGVNARKCDSSNLCCVLTSRVQVMGESCQNVRFPQFLVSLTWASRLLSHETLHPPRRPVKAVATQVSDKGSCIRDGHRLCALLGKKVSCEKYFLLLRRMKLPCTGWLGSPNCRDDRWGENIWFLSKTQRHAWPSFHWSVKVFPL